MAGNVKDINDNSFEAEVLKSGIPVLVDFWAPWCGPCKSIAPTLEQISLEYDGKIKVVKLNVDDNLRSPAQYDVRGIPNLVFFKNGAMVDRVVGSVPKEQLVEVINKLI